jgi:hypothetical protein
MRLINAGGRRYKLSEEDLTFLDSLEGVTEVVHGGATGADEAGWGMGERPGYSGHGVPGQLGEVRPVRWAEAKPGDGAVRGRRGAFPGRDRHREHGSHIPTRELLQSPLGS